MSDWIERDGKKYFEESYLTLANTLATKAVAKREQRIAALEAENAALRAELRTRIDLIMFDRRGLLGLIRSRLERAADAEGKNLHMLDLVDAVCSGVASLRADKERVITPHPLDEWHEDYSFALWWRFPICDPPYCGDPGCSDWPFDDDDEVWWTPMVDANAIHHAIDAARGGKA